MQLPTPDLFFWYTLSTVLAAVLVTIIAKYISKLEKVLSLITATLSELKTLHLLLEKDMKLMKRDMEELKPKTRR